MPEFYSEQRVKARKPHTCCETGRVIPKGEFYWRMTGKWDGDLQTFAQTDAAYHFARWMNGVGSKRGYDHDYCIGFGDIGDAVREREDPELTAEWERVKLGEVTRDTTRKPREAA